MIELTTWNIIILTGIGITAGFINVIAGGGSMLTVPAMLFMGVPGPVANGTNRIAILAQNFVAVTTFFRKGFSDFRLSLTLALCAVPGAVIGAWYGVQLHGVWFNRVLALVMIGVMLIMHNNRPSTIGSINPVTMTRKRIITAHGLMFVAGLYGGFIQIGVGFLIMPILHRVLGLDLVRVNMHKVFVVGCFTLAALIVFSSQLELIWGVGIALAVGNSIGGWLGAHSSIKRGDHWISMVFNLIIIALIVKLLLF